MPPGSGGDARASRKGASALSKVCHPPLHLGVADKLEQDAQVVTGAAGPSTGQAALQLVGGELSCEGVCLQKSEGHLDVSENTGLTFNRPAERAAKGVAPKELSHSPISATRSATVPR